MLHKSAPNFTIAIAHLFTFIVMCLALAYKPPQDYLWVHFLIISAVLIWVPMALHWCAAKGYLLKIVPKLSLPTGILYVSATYIASPILSFLFTIPWILIALYSTFRVAFRQRRYTFDHFLKVVAFAFWIIAAVWGASYQLEYYPFNFSPVIVLLTAAHFHFAGFLLTLLAAVLLKRLKHEWWAFVWSGLILLAVPLTAAGILTTHLSGNQALETIAGVTMAIGGIGVAGAYAKLGWQNKAGYLCVAGGILLICGMILAALYALRVYYPIPWLDIPFMYQVHGSANMLGLGALAITVFWKRELSK